MLYCFVKKDGNAERIGDADIELLNTKLAEYLANGFVEAEVAEYDEQVIKSAQITVPAGIESAPVEVVEAAPVVVEASVSSPSESI